MGGLGSRHGHRNVQPRLGTPLFGQSIFSRAFGSANFPIHGVTIKLMLVFGVLELRI